MFRQKPWVFGSAGIVDHAVENRACDMIERSAVRLWRGVGVCFDVDRFVVWGSEGFDCVDVVGHDLWGLGFGWERVLETTRW